jgi:hypothetical protein
MASLLKLRQAAWLIGVSLGKLYRAIADGRLTAALGGGPGKPTLVSIEAVRTFCRSEGLRVPDEAEVMERSGRSERSRGAQQDVERGGRYDACWGAIYLWSHHWAHPATCEVSETFGTFYMHWDPPMLYEIETDEGFALEGLLQKLGRLELKAFGRVKHGDVPPVAEG